MVNTDHYFFKRWIKVLVYVGPHRAHTRHVYTGKTHAVYGHIAQDYVMQAHMIIHVDAVHDFCMPGTVQCVLSMWESIETSQQSLKYHTGFLWIFFLNPRNAKSIIELTSRKKKQHPNCRYWYNTNMTTAAAILKII